jgi:hypothetical protein
MGTAGTTQLLLPNLSLGQANCDLFKGSLLLVSTLSDDVVSRREGSFSRPEKKIEL